MYCLLSIFIIISICGGKRRIKDPEKYYCADDDGHSVISGADLDKTRLFFQDLPTLDVECTVYILNNIWRHVKDKFQTLGYVDFLKKRSLPRGVTVLVKNGMMEGLLNLLLEYAFPEKDEDKSEHLERIIGSQNQNENLPYYALYTISCLANDYFNDYVFNSPETLAKLKEVLRLYISGESGWTYYEQRAACKIASDLSMAMTFTGNDVGEDMWKMLKPSMELYHSIVVEDLSEPVFHAMQTIFKNTYQQFIQYKDKRNDYQEDMMQRIVDAHMLADKTDPPVRQKHPFDYAEGVMQNKAWYTAWGGFRWTATFFENAAFCVRYHKGQWEVSFAQKLVDLGFVSEFVNFMHMTYYDFLYAEGHEPEYTVQALLLNTLEQLSNIELIQREILANEPLCDLLGRFSVSLRFAQPARQIVLNILSSNDTDIFEEVMRNSGRLKLKPLVNCYSEIMDNLLDNPESDLFGHVGFTEREEVEFMFNIGMLYCDTIEKYEYYEFEDAVVREILANFVEQCKNVRLTSKQANEFFMDIDLDSMEEEEDVFKFRQTIYEEEIVRVFDGEIDSFDEIIFKNSHGLDFIEQTIDRIMEDGLSSKDLEIETQDLVDQYIAILGTMLSTSMNDDKQTALLAIMSESTRLCSVPTLLRATYCAEWNNEGGVDKLVDPACFNDMDFWMRFCDLGAADLGMGAPKLDSKTLDRIRWESRERVYIRKFGPPTHLTERGSEFQTTEDAEVERVPFSHHLRTDSRFHYSDEYDYFDSEDDDDFSTLEFLRSLYGTFAAEPEEDRLFESADEYVDMLEELGKILELKEVLEKSDLDDEEILELAELLGGDYFDEEEILELAELLGGNYFDEEEDDFEFRNEL